MDNAGKSTESSGGWVDKFLCGIGQHDWQDVDKEVTIFVPYEIIHNVPIHERKRDRGGLFSAGKTYRAREVRVCRREHCDLAQAKVYTVFTATRKSWEIYTISKRAVLDGVKDFHI